MIIIIIILHHITLYYTLYYIIIMIGSCLWLRIAVAVASSTQGELRASEETGKTHAEPKPEDLQ